MAAMLAAGGAGAASAGAANWDPPNTAVTAQLIGGASTLTFSGAQVTCTSADWTQTAASATQSVAKTTAAHNPVNFTNCSSGALGTATITTFGIWSFTADSTTSVTLRTANGSSPVFQLAFHGFPSCVVSVGGFDLPGNTWSNSTHNIVLNSAATFAASSTAGCLGLWGTVGTLTGTFNIPAASIT